MSRPLELAMSVAREFRRVPLLRSAYERTDTSRRARRLARSGLIDTQLYALQLGVDTIDVDDAAAHYAKWGHWGGLTLNALLDDSTLRTSLGGDGRPPIYDYFWNRDWSLAVSPLWDVEAYVRLHPESREHAFGPVGHLWARILEDDGVEIPFASAHGSRSVSARDLKAMVARPLGAWAETDVMRRARRLSPHFQGVETLGDWPAHVQAPLVSVVLATWNRAGALRDAAESVLGQTWRNLELIIVDDGSWDDTPSLGDLLAARDERVRYLPRPHAGVSAARNAGIEIARGDFVTFLDSDNEWDPRFIENMMVGMREQNADVAYATLEVRSESRPLFREAAATPSALSLGNVVDLNTLVVGWRALDDVGGFDTHLPRAVDYDLILRLAAEYELVHLPVRGAIYDNRSEGTDRISTSQPLGWNTHVRVRNLVEWPDVDEPLATGTSVVVMLARQDPAIDRKLHELSELGRSTDITIHLTMLDPSPSDWLRADLFEREHNGVVAHYFPGAEPYSYVVTMVAAVADRERLVVIEPSSHPTPETITALSARIDPARRRMVAPLMLYPDGTTVTAGAAFPKAAAAPIDILSRHPVEDAETLGPEIAVPALSGRTFGVPTRDFMAIRGLDPLLYNAYELPAAAVRLRETFEDYEFATLADVRMRRVAVPHDFEHADIAGSHAAIRAITAEEPATDLSVLLRPLALTVSHFRAVDSRVWTSSEDRGRGDAEDEVPRVSDGTPAVVTESHLHPVVVRSRRMVEVEGRQVPRLRWAIRIASPAFPAGGTWGDTHFARSLARALESLGQEVVLDHHEVRRRPTAYLDDVTLVLRGLDRVEPVTGGTSILWIISHPDLVTRTEAAAFDHVFAASTSWSARASERWSLPVTPLLQCTDQDVFFPTDAPRRDDVVFVGKSRGVARPAVVYPVRAGIPVRVFGGEWEGILPAHAVEAEYIANNQLGELYGRAGVVLNDHWSDMRRDGFISNRLFDVVASGGRVLSDRVDGIEDVFGGAVVPYDSPLHLVDMLSGDLEALFPPAADLAEHSRRIRSDHSFEARARTLFETVLRDRSHY